MFLSPIEKTALDLFAEEKNLTAADVAFISTFAGLPLESRAGLRDSQLKSKRRATKTNSRNFRVLGLKTKQISNQDPTTPSLRYSKPNKDPSEHGGLKLNARGGD